MPSDESAVSTAEIRRQITALMHWTLTSTADEVVELEHGFALQTRSLPSVWTPNQVRLASSTSAEELTALADKFQGDLGFRHVVVEGESGAELVAQLGERWSSTRGLVMAMTTAVDRHVDTSNVVELSEPDMLTLMRSWLLEGQREISPSGLDQVIEYNRREGALFGETRLGVVEGEVPLAVAKLRLHHRLAWVEDVYTVPTARGRGLARAVIAEALRRAWDLEAAFAFIIADDDDWPKDFYGRAGFTGVDRFDTFHRDAA